MIQHRIERARTAMALRQYEAAKREATAILADEPQHTLANLIFGEALLRSNQFAEARAQAEQLIGIAPEWGWGFWLLGWSWLMDSVGYPGLTGRAKRMPYALSAARQALVCDPDEPAFYGLAAAAAIESGHAQAGLEYADRGLEVAAGSPYLHRLRGQALRLLNRPDQALRSLEASLRLAPDDSISHREVAEILFERSQYRAANERICEAMRLEPSDSYARDLMFRIVQTQHWLLRSAIWFYDHTRLLRGYLWIAWVAVVLIVAVPLAYWIESTLRDHWAGDVIQIAWMLLVFAPAITLAIPWITNFLWITLGRDAAHLGLSGQERWDRAFPGLTIVSAGPVIGLAIWLQSLVPIEYFATAFVAALMQSCGAAMANSRAKFTFFAVAGLYASLVPPLLIHRLLAPQNFETPALVVALPAIWATLLAKRQFSGQ
jgi:hypothetical protein